jgi:hypothetical protein
MSRIRVSKETWNTVTRSNPWATPWAKPENAPAKRPRKQQQAPRWRRTPRSEPDPEAVNSLMMLGGIVALVVFVLYAISR